MTNTKESTIKVVRDERGRFTKKDEKRPFRVGDRVAHTYTRENDPGIIKRINGDTAFVKWEVDRQQWNLIENLYHFPESKKPENLVLSVPEEIPAALQTLAKAFGYRVEKA